MLACSLRSHFRTCRYPSLNQNELKKGFNTKLSVYFWITFQRLCFNGILSLRIDRPLTDFLQGLSVGVSGRQSLTNGASPLFPQIQRLVLLVLVHFTQVLLLLLVHNNINTGDSFADHTAKNKNKPIYFFKSTKSITYLHLGKLGCGSTSDFGHTQDEEFIFELFQLLSKLFFVFCSQI